jgi:LCP family protein required for cell wall assembly
MYKFQSNKSDKKRAIDGILSTGPRRPIAPKTPSKEAGTVNAGFSRPRQPFLDDFNKPEGFRGRMTPKLTGAGSYEQYDEPKLTAKAISNRGRSQSIIPKKYKKSRNRRKMFKKTAIVMMVAVLLFGGFFAGKFWWNARKAFRGGGSALAFNTNIDPNLLNGEGDGRVNILLLGKGGENHAGGELTDSMMIFSIDPINNKLAMLSIPRDLWVKPQGLWGMKINAVYASAKDQALGDNYKDKAGAEKAGISAVSSTVEQYLGVRMHYYSMIEFSAFEEAVDTLGGVDITLNEPFSDPTMKIGSKYLYLPAGTQHVNGAVALGYARSRYGSARGDFDRGAQQQNLLIGIKNKLLTVGTFANPLKVSQLLTTFGNRVQSNLSIDDMMRVYGIIKNLQSGDITNADLAQPPNPVVRTGSVGDQSAVMPTAGLNNFDEVRAFVRNFLKDGFLVKENPSVIVLNGSNVAGAAQKRADELKGYGYNVVSVGDSPKKDVTSPILIDRTKGQKKYTKRYLEQRFHTTAEDKIDGIDLMQYQADFIVIIGSQG